MFLLVKIQIGNAAINEPTDTLGLFDYAWSHAIISDQLYDKINKECGFKGSGNQTAHCGEHLTSFMEAYSGIDMYSIYTPVCLHSSGRTYSKLLVAPRLLTQHVGPKKNFLPCRRYSMYIHFYMLSLLLTYFI